MGMAAGLAGVALPGGGSISVVASADEVILLVHGRPELAARMPLKDDGSVVTASGHFFEGGI